MEKEFKNKNIILGVPNHFGLPEKFKENLEFLGFKVFLLENSNQFKMGFSDTLKHVSKKIFKNDKTYKAKKKAEFFENQHLNFIENINEKIDYSLIIRPDLYSKKVIQKIKKIANLSAAYQWDGLDRYPLAKELIDDFDRFFVFDVHDLKYKGTKPLTNFYFDDANPKTEISQDVFFVGTYIRDRIDLLVRLSRKLDELKLKTNINLQCNKEKYYQNLLAENIHFIKKGLDFQENIGQVLKSKILLDFRNEIHYGISFRAFECIGYKKKLITNNALVKKYDFYHPDNIFVIENNDLNGLEQFIEKLYFEIDEKIVEKYSFTNWIKYVLDIEPHQKMELHL